jgi:homeobox protein CDX
MVSYYNHPFAMYQKNHGGGSNLPYSASPTAAAWYSSNYHHQAQNAAAAQFLGGPGGPDSDGHQPMYYPPHHVFHQSSPDWSSHDNYGVPPQTGSLLQTSTGSLNNGLGAPGSFLSINQATQNHNLNVNHGEHINDGLQSLPSPPNTVSVGSDTSSPGVQHGSASPQMNSSHPTPVKSPYEWMKKPSYTSQPNPGNFHFIPTAIVVSFLTKIVHHFQVESSFDHHHKIEIH